MTPEEWAAAFGLRFGASPGCGQSKEAHVFYRLILQEFGGPTDKWCEFCELVHLSVYPDTSPNGEEEAQRFKDNWIAFGNLLMK